MKTVAVIGAGAVGVCCALALQRRGLAVTLVERGEPGGATSSGNAGVIARSMILPFNNPRLLPSLPVLLRNRTPQFRYRLGYVLRNAGWCLGFLANSRGAAFERTVQALDDLMRISLAEHRRLVAESNAEARVRGDGWLHLYRTAAQRKATEFARATYERYGIRTQVLQPGELHQLEPDLARHYESALWIREALTVDDPGALVADYARLFASRGGAYVRREVTALRKGAGGQWILEGGTQEALRASDVVIAQGPWSGDLLRPLGLRIPMAFERGYHVQRAAREGARLQRPVLDVAGGFVMAPMLGSIRISTGVELVHRDAPAGRAQVELAERAAADAFPLGERVRDVPWLGSRPSLPDSRPMIGGVPQHTGIWLAFGHHHIGLAASAGTGVLLADLMCGDPPCIDPAPFAPGRYC